MLNSLIFPLCLLLTAQLETFKGEKIASNQNVCRTEECLKSANHLANSMNKSADPCDDFYQYACGNFKEYTKDMHAEGTIFSFITQASLTYSTKVLESIKSNITKSDPEAIKKVKTLYKTCMDTDAMNAKGLEPLRKVLEKVGLSYTTPFINYNERFDWIQTAVKLKKVLNKEFIFSVGVTTDPRNHSINYISIKMPQGSSNYQDLASNVMVGSFSSYVRAITEIIDKDVDVKNITNYPFRLAVGINELASVLLGSEKLRHGKVPEELPDPKLMTLKELQEMTDSIDDGTLGKKTLNWNKYLNLLFEDVESITLGTENGTELIHLYDEVYVKDAIKFVAQYNKFFERALWWSVFTEISKYTTNEFRNKEDEYVGYPLIGQQCAEEVKKYMHMAIAYSFVNEKTVKKQNEAVQMFNYLKHVFEELVNISDWMDNETKKHALEKIEFMRSYVSHPSWLNNATELDKQYEHVLVNNNDFLASLLHLKKESVQKDLKQLRAINDLKHPDVNNINTLQVNAMYWSEINSIIIPMGILQFPFYEHPLQVLNYGMLGSIIGHEITHGFDNNGKYSDAIGNIRNWWQNETSTEYNKRAQCFIDSYDGIEVFPGIKVDGKASLSENIADCGGFRQALLAYKKYLELIGPEPLLPGFENFTPEQLLTLAFANLWCEASTSSKLRKDVKSKHSPNSVRANGPLKNSREFSKIWKCREGSGMNPAKKCKLW